ncbi:sigma-54-dependent Fis family transcriptional regulator [Candidatus Poribacteria bacterium]|nr:sigma-54-dependent Fis family transcriptional regulator [Candidatus Poribacteria bacterium]
MSNDPQPSKTPIKEASIMSDSIDAKNAKILIVDDFPANLNLLGQTLESAGYKVVAVPSGTHALQIAARTEPDLILLDVMMPEMDGFETCRRLKANPSTAEIPVIFITAKDEIESLIEGFEVGGVDYITKPFNEKEVWVRVQNHLEVHRLTQALLRKNKELQEEITQRKQAELARDEAEDARQTANAQLSILSQREAERWGIQGFIGNSKTIERILDDVRQLQTFGTTSVLILGESGTGKELIARAIHFGGSRAEGAFIPLNCSAIPHELAESTLFGHLKGAFTGATTDRKGYFELANGGTLFLDEIGDMPLELQAKLLRVLEDGTFTPVGGTQEQQADVRVVAATNADLHAKIASGAFREDLYYRLARFPVQVPPLRERKEDIPLLANHFLEMLAQEMRIESPALTPEAVRVLEAYPFPGNVRELKNQIEHALIKSRGKAIQPEHLHFIEPPTTDADSPIEAMVEAIPPGHLPYREVLDRFERQYIEKALSVCNGNRSQTAKMLGIDRRILYDKMARLDIDIPASTKTTN